MDKIKKADGYYVLDILHIVKSVWHRVWIIIFASVICAAVSFSISAFLIAPKYSSTIMLYVNNKSVSTYNPNFSITSSEITAAQSLVKTYGEILNNQATLERVIDKAGLSCDYKKLSKMIDYGSVNGTEIMYVTVRTEDPNESAKIANDIADILPNRIGEIIDGASVTIVNYATPNSNQSSPNITIYTIIGVFVGFFVSLIWLICLALLDNTVHDEEYVINVYDLPILAKIPNLLDSRSKKYGYSYYKKNNTSDRSK